MTWWKESMREGSQTGFRPNRTRSQRVQSNSVTSLRAAWKEWMGVGLIVNADPAYRYEINDLKDRCREKLLDFFIALRREIEDEDFLTLKLKERAGTGWKRQRREQPTGRAYLRSTNLPRQTSICTKPTRKQNEKKKGFFSCSCIALPHKQWIRRAGWATFSGKE